MDKPTEGRALLRIPVRRLAELFVQDHHTVIRAGYDIASDCFELVITGDDLEPTLEGYEARRYVLDSKQVDQEIFK